VEMTIEQKRALALTRARMRAAAQAEQTQRAVSGMSDQQLAAEAYEQPAPPPGVTINYGENDRRLQTGGGKEVPTTEADARARASRDADGMTLLGDRAGALLRGVPFAGPFTSRAVAGTKALMGDGEYADNLTNEQARDSTYDADRPVESTALKIAGAIGGTAAMYPLIGGSAIGQGLLGVGGKTMAGAVARGVTAGATQGLAQGVGDSRDITNVGETLPQAGLNALYGGALGGFIPAAVGAGGMVVDKFRNQGTDVVDALSAPAKKYVLGMIDDPQRLAAQRAEIQRLGPNAALADASQEWLGVAQGSASRPGSRAAVVDALKARDAGKNARLQGAVDANFGEAPTPSWQDARIKGNQRAIGPVYDRAVAGQPPIDVNVGLASRVDDALLNAKGEEKAILNEIRDTLLMQNNQPDINAAGVHGTRKALDLLSEKHVASPRKLDIIREYRSEVDAALKGNIKRFGRLDTAYAEMANQRKMLEKGGTVFDTGKTAIRPEELNSVISNNRPASNRMLSAGARAEIDRIVGNNANDVAKMNSLLKGEGDWNREKLRLLFGQDKADDVLRILDAERVMEDTKRLVVDGSQSSPRLEFADKLKEMAKGRDIPSDRTAVGLALAGVQKAARRIGAKQGDDAADQFAKELAKLSVATGAQRDQIIAALMQRGVRKSVLNKFYEAGGRGVATANPVTNALMNAREDR
jgi:hypothetical protein